MENIKEKEAEMLGNLELLEDWNDKYQYIIEIGENLPDLNEEHKIDDHLVKGCQSKLYLELNN